MSLQALKDELLAGHPVTGAYDADDALAAAEVMAVNVDVVGPITVTELREWAATNARAFKLDSARTTGSTDQVKSLAIIGMSVLNSGPEGLDPANATHVALVNELVADGVWSAADRTALIAKATKVLSRAEILSLGRVRAGEVAQARAL